MALDHLVGNESESPDTGLVDPLAFAVSVALSIGVAVLLFGSVVPRAENRGPERAAVIGLILSVLSFVPGIGFLWLGFPFVIAGCGHCSGARRPVWSAKATRDVGTGDGRGTHLGWDGVLRHGRREQALLTESSSSPHSARSLHRCEERSSVASVFFDELSDSQRRNGCGRR